MNVFNIGLLVENRGDNGPMVQEVLTRYGQDILARFGIPDRKKENGLISLFIETEESSIYKLKDEVENIPGVSMSIMKMR